MKKEPSLQSVDNPIDMRKSDKHDVLMSCRMEDLCLAPLMKLGKQIGYNTNRVELAKRLGT